MAIQRKSTLAPALAVAAICGIAAAAFGNAANAQTTETRPSTNIPVLVMGEDSDPTTVKRSSDIFKRVLAELKGSMQRYNYRMVDEEHVAVELGFTIRERRPKTELIQMAQMFNQSGKARNRVRAWVLFRIHASAKKLSFATQVFTRIDGEIYDAVTNQFLDTFEIPQQKYPAPADCLDNKLCITEVVGAKAREIATDLGDILAKKLLRYAPPKQVAGPVTAQPGGAVPVTRAPAPAHSGMVTTYELALRHFDAREALSIVGVMSDEFPGYSSHELLSKGSAIRKYEYVTSATAAKLDEWLSILMNDMGFDIGTQVNVSVSGNEIVVDKLVPTPNRPRSGDEKKRFQ